MKDVRYTSISLHYFIHALIEIPKKMNEKYLFNFIIFTITKERAETKTKATAIKTTDEFQPNRTQKATR